MKPSTAQWRFVLKQTLPAVGVNVAMTALMAWVVYRNVDTVSLFDDNSYALDVVMSTFFFMFFTSLMTSRSTHKAVRTGAIAPLEWVDPPSLIKEHPPRAFVGSIALAALTALLILPLVAGLLSVLDADVMTPDEFIRFKALFVGAMACIVTPLVTLISLTEAAPE